MTACGHVFSLPSIVHCMLDGSGEYLLRAATCPLCYEPVSARDLRLVVARTRPRPDLSRPLPFTLLRRPHNSNVPQPADAPAPPAPDPTDPLASQPFARFVRVADGFPTFRVAAAALAAHTATVIFEGGQEAEIEGPSLFKSMDVLASAAHVWYARKAEAAGGVVGDAADDAATAAAEREAAAMDEALRGIFSVELEAAQRRVAAAVSDSRDAAAIHEAFPALGTAATPRQRRGRAAADEMLFALEGDGHDASAGSSPRGGSDGEGGAVPRRSASEAGPGGHESDVAGQSPKRSASALGADAAGRSPKQRERFTAMEDGAYWFYQAADGSSLFLHPVNVRRPELRGVPS